MHYATDTQKWGFFNSSPSIRNLILSLNKKGIRERTLYENLLYLVKNGYLVAYPDLEDVDKKSQ